MNNTKQDNNMYIKGKRIILRNKKINDVKNDFAWRTNEELSKLDATTPISFSFNEFNRYSQQEIDFPSLSSVRLAIDTVEGEHIGNIMYYDIDLRKSEAELGIMLGKEFWGKGYGLESLELLIHHIFSKTSLNRIYLHTLDWNIRAQKSFERAGFQLKDKIKRSSKQEFFLMDIIKINWIENNPVFQEQIKLNNSYNQNDAN